MGKISGKTGVWPGTHTEIRLYIVLGNASGRNTAFDEVLGC